MENSFSLSKADQKIMKNAMRLSFWIGVLMLFIKGYAYYITSSVAIFSDAAETIIHIIAVGFAYYSMRLSLKPPDADHLYGHDKINFFSAGFEGAMIIIAALLIIHESIDKIINGLEISQIDEGIIFIFLATTINALLSYYLIRKGRKYQSIILESNGKHILTDCITSIAVIFALILVKLTGIIYFDPLIALLAAGNILFIGSKLIKKSISGLMDQVDPKLNHKIKKCIDDSTKEQNVFYHNLKHRMTGYKLNIEFHILFPKEISLKEAHEIASKIEADIKKQLDIQSDIVTHLEPKKEHDKIHKKYGLSI
ncbi:MAG: cation diffusion facilitator family transporter [Parachlamydiaceae bacterium]|nr:cation diffusion facilitator family transporter [Parachlamydiaceae bacterium]